MANNSIQHHKSISDYHAFRGLPKPEHPLVSVVRIELITILPEDEPKKIMNDFYSIALKRNFNGRMKYGQQSYDFNEGILFFVAPGQIFSLEAAPGELNHTGWQLLIHPDFLWNTSLAKTIRQYEYFDYSVNEALHLSEKEENTMIAIMQSMEQEYHANIDKFSQTLIIAQLELFFAYADRFYHRQFLTRKISSHSILQQLEIVLTDNFEDKKLAEDGLPTVEKIAEALHVSPNYLGSLLKIHTGQSTQQHIHDRLIQKAKQMLSSTRLSVSEIAYSLGFEHPQSFSKLFKTKTTLSPLQFRHSFEN